MARRAGPQKSCEWCGKLFNQDRKNHKYCSKYCANAHQKQKKREQKEPNWAICEACGEYFIARASNSRVCSSSLCRRAIQEYHRKKSRGRKLIPVSAIRDNLIERENKSVKIDIYENVCYKSVNYWGDIWPDFSGIANVSTDDPIYCPFPTHEVVKEAAGDGVHDRTGSSGEGLSYELGVSL